MRKIFVQHCESKLFLRDGEGWTPQADEARDFETSLNALAFCLQSRMNHAQIVVRFDTPGSQDVVVPIQSEDSSISQPLSR
jgi:hypothetical protein